MFKFKIETNNQDIKAFNKQFNRKYCYIVNIGFGLVGIGGLILYIISNEDKDIKFGSELFFIAVLTMVIFNLFLKLFIQVIASNKLRYKTARLQYVIDENKIIETIIRDDCEIHTKHNWNYVNKAYETKTHYFLSISQTQAYILPKSDMIEGTYDEFSKLLKLKLGKKFKRI